MTKARNIGYAAAFHGLRLPLYLLAAMAWALRGMNLLALRVAYVLARMRKRRA